MEIILNVNQHVHQTLVILNILYLFKNIHIL